MESQNIGTKDNSEKTLERVRPAPTSMDLISESDSTNTNSKSSLADLLARDSCRCLLATLADAPTTVDDVVETVADGPDPIQRDRIRLFLYRIYLPKLSNAGLIDYDLRTGDIVRTADINPP